MASVEEAMGMDRLQLAVLIIDTFVRYPLPSRWIPREHDGSGSEPLLRIGQNFIFFAGKSLVEIFVFCPKARLDVVMTSAPMRASCLRVGQA